MLAVEYRAVDTLVPYARNSRTHDEGQVAQIAGSIKEFGFTNPVLIDEEGGIIAGHGRVLAARKLGMAEVPTITLAGLTDAQRRAYVIADNKLALNAGWDFEMLAVELDELRDAEFDMDLLGFATEELNELIGTDKLGPEPGEEGSGAGSLADRFMIPPFSVFNAREGWWQERKRAWLALGIKSELGRGDCIPGGGGSAESQSAYLRNGKSNSRIAGGGQAQAAAPGPHATTASGSAATARGGR